MRALLVLLILASGCRGHGDTCTVGMYGDDCAPGLTCRDDDLGGTGVCECIRVEHNLDQGQECDDPSACGTCRDTLRCNRKSDTCIVPQAIATGGACAEDNDCMFGLICSGFETCETPNSHIEGHRCYQSRECATGLVCGIDRLCVTEGMGGDGARCGEPTECAPGLTCGTPLDPEHCRPLGIVGSLCDDATQCEAGLVCSTWFSPAQCAPGAIGDPCLADRDCQPGSVCTTNVCF